MTQEKNPSVTDIKKALKSLVEDGAIWARCPKCNIEMSHKELSKSKCDTCGKIEYDKILFYAKTDKHAC